MLARDDRLEVMGHPPLVQIVADHGLPAGGSHGHGEVLLVQPGQQGVQPRLFGDRGGEEDFIRYPVQTLHDAIGIAVRAVKAPHHVAGGLARRAPGGLGQALFVGQAQRLEGRVPECGPHPLGVEHGAVHIKNHAVYHKKESFLLYAPRFILSYFTTTYTPQR